MRSRSHRQVWALGDCAAIPGPNGRPYPALAQHAIREARHLADNIRAVIDGRVPSAFMFRSLGTMASLGHTRAVARVFGVPLTGFLAWWLRRSYYLFQMPRWDRRLRIVLDWTVAFFLRPDITRVDLRVEREQVKQVRQLVKKSGEIVCASHWSASGESLKRVAERDGYSAARLLRFDWLLNTFTASLAVSGTEANEKHVARAEQSGAKQQ
jgi:hypothetical protein